MAFHFSLDAVLHLQQSVEHQHELRLQAINHQIARGYEMIDQADQRMAEIRRLGAGALQEGTTSAEIGFRVLSVEQWTTHRAELERVVTRLKDIREQQVRILEQERRKRKILEGLRDRQQREYARKAVRQAQRKLDELYLLRRGFLDRG